VADEQRVKITARSPRFSLVALKFGYMESPNVPKALAIARKHGWQFDIMSTSFFLSRRALKPAVRSGMPRWQDHLFIGLAKSASDATDFFQIPTGRVVEVGTQVAVGVVVPAGSAAGKRSRTSSIDRAIACAAPYIAAQHFQANPCPHACRTEPRRRSRRAAANDILGADALAASASSGDIGRAFYALREAVTAAVGRTAR
jgi:hypothetical protein